MITIYKEMKQKAVLRWIVLAGIALFVAYKFAYGYYQSNKFYNARLRELVVKRDNSALRSTVFELEGGVYIDSSLVEPFDLRVGDSIVKEPASRKFRVYRKMERKEFTLIHIYNSTG